MSLDEGNQSNISRIYWTWIYPAVPHFLDMALDTELGTFISVTQHHCSNKTKGPLVWSEHNTTLLFSMNSKLEQTKRYAEW